MRNIPLVLLFLSLASCGTLPKEKLYPIDAQQLVDGHKTFELGGLSGLHFDRKESTKENLIFYTLTDRGPNGKKFDRNKNGIKEPIWVIALKIFPWVRLSNFFINIIYKTQTL